MPDHTPGVVAVSEGPKMELNAVVGALAPIVTVVAPAGIVRPRPTSAAAKKENFDFDIVESDLIPICDPPEQSVRIRLL